MNADGRRSPPPSIEALRARADGLRGHSFGEIAMALGVTVGENQLRTKGKFGDLFERALGATGGSAADHDFPALGVELKTLPLDPRGKPKESTYVCTLHLHTAEQLQWETSWVKRKLTRVLFIATDGSTIAWPERVVRASFLWEPTPDVQAQLQADFEEAVGLVTAGRIEDLTAHLGTYMQVRPKAANASVKTAVFDAENGLVNTVPKGFYLRARFTDSLMRAALRP